MTKLLSLPRAVWGFLDGWKTWLWAVIVAAKIAWPSWALWSLVDAAARQIGWDALVPAVDPGALVQWVTFAVAVGHKLAKAVDQYRAGVPLAKLQSHET